MIADTEFESPLFKVLAKNDTGQRSSHQGGFVLPKDLRKYFPDLRDASINAPTPDVPIQAILVDGVVRLGEVPTRYQLQSWGGTRSGETRITGGVDQLLNTAGQDDILLIERKIDSEDVYRLTLLRSATDAHSAVLAQIGSSRWGVLPGFEPPIEDRDVERAQAEIVSTSGAPFQAFGSGEKVLTSNYRVARSRAFARLVLSAYERRCAICGGGIRGLGGRSELEAAHIIGKGHNGSDDVRNGIALCRSDHWAFDHLVISVDADMRVKMHPEAMQMPQNKRLLDLVGSTIAIPSDPGRRPHPTALKWHYDRVFTA